MSNEQPGQQKNARTTDPYLDRRCGEDRRQAYDLDYFTGGGSERRSGRERRLNDERRNGWVKFAVTKNYSSRPTCS